MNLRRTAHLALTALLLTNPFVHRVTAAPSDIAGLAGLASSATATALAEPIPPDVDLVSVYQTSELSSSVRKAALAAATASRAPAVVGRGFSIGLIRLRRGGTVVQQASRTGWAFPMGITALPVDAIRGVMGRAVAGVISGGQVVMGQTTAALRGALAGDIVDLRTVSGGTVSFTIGLVAPDDLVGGTEILMSTDQASLLGATVDTRVLIFGPFDRATVEHALSVQGLTTNSSVRVRRSWDPLDPDRTLGMARTKQLLGEFDLDYAHVSDYGWTELGSAWRDAYLPPSRELYPGGILARCNRVIYADLVADLQEVVDSGLGGHLDVANSNTYGGCSAGQARLGRLTQAIGTVSRHSWGQPIDINTSTNCQGCVPAMDCRIVSIFRKHNFAWGGNFLTPDGMHFEWVGEARDTLAYPSRYCPNQVLTATSTDSAPPSQRGTMFAGDGWTEG